MLDRIPEVNLPEPGGHVRGDSGGEATLRVGLRTAAFGAVEIYTSVHQNQVGLTLHSTRDLAQWFTSEVQAIETRLNDQHLNLGSVDLQNSSSGFQADTGSHHQAPAHTFNNPARGPEAESSDAADLPAEPAAPAAADPLDEKRVSILI